MPAAARAVVGTGIQARYDAKFRGANLLCIRELQTAAAAARRFTLQYELTQPATQSATITTTGSAIHSATFSTATIRSAVAARTAITAAAFATANLAAGSAVRAAATLQTANEPIHKTQ